MFRVQRSAAENMTESLSDVEWSALGPKTLAASPRSAKRTTVNRKPLTRLPVYYRTAPRQAAAENDEQNVVADLDPACAMRFIQRDSDSRG